MQNIKILIRISGVIGAILDIQHIFYLITNYSRLVTDNIVSPMQYYKDLTGDFFIVVFIGFVFYFTKSTDGD
jgi:hypothetical protein